MPPKKKVSKAKAASRSYVRYAQPAAKAGVVETLRRASRGAASKAGAALGSYFGGPVGGLLGSSAGNLFSKITGWGDYKVNLNSIIMPGSSPPMFKNSRSGVHGTVIRHREFITDIIGSTEFTNRSFPINIGLSGTFPWGAEIGGNFEQYRILGMLYEFKSTSATSLTSGTNTAMGTVIMATEYNSASAAFASKAQMENHEFCTSNKPSETFVHAIECAPNQTSVPVLYVRNGSVPSNSDVRLYDLGNFQLATVGMQNANTIGELWCTYEIELIKPSLYDSLEYDILTDHYQLPVSTISTGNYFGTSFPLLPVASSNLGTSITSSNVLTLPYSPFPQRYMIVYSVVGNSSTITNSMARTLSSGLTIPNLWNNDNTARLTQFAGATANVQLEAIFVDVAAGNLVNTLTYTAGTLPGTPEGGDLWIMQANPLVVQHNAGLFKRRHKSLRSHPFLGDPRSPSTLLEVKMNSSVRAPVLESKGELEDEKADDDSEEDMKAFLQFMKFKRMQELAHEDAVVVSTPIHSVSSTPRLPSKK